MEEEKLKLTDGRDPSQTLLSVAELGMKQYVMSKPELTFELVHHAMDPVMSDKIREKRNQIVKSDKNKTVKFLEEASLTFTSFQELGLGFKKSEKTLLEQLKAGADRHLEEEMDRALAEANMKNGFTEQNGIKPLERGDVRVRWIF